MKKRSFAKRLTSLLLAMTMMMTIVPQTALAATVGELSEGETGVTGTLDTNDTISLPIKIYDYKNDGMLFEYLEQAGSGTATDVWMRETNVSKPTFSVGNDFTLKTASIGAISYSGASYVTDAKATAGNTAVMPYLKWAKDASTSACLTVFDRSQEGHSATRYKISDIRYLVLVYRSTNGSEKDTASFDMWNYTTNARTNKVTVNYDNRGTTWRYMIVDLAATGATMSDYVTAVYGFLPAGTGVAFAGYFSTEPAAESFGQNAVRYTGETYHYAGDNRAFGLLRYSRTTAYGNNSTDDNIGIAYDGTDTTVTDSDGIYLVNSYSSDGDIDISALDFKYGDYKLYNTFAEDGIATLGLLEKELKNGLPVYKQATVEYVAQLLMNSLAIPAIDPSTGYKNYQFVQGAAEERYGGVDFAQWLRNKCSGLGTYDSTKNKNLVGKWEDVSGNISTYMDAAYFMLNSIFLGGSYNTPMNDYDYLALSATTETSGEKVYIFDAGFATNADPDSAVSAVKYDQANHMIQNTSAAGKTMYVFEVNSESGKASYTTYYPFLPIVDSNGNNTNGVTNSPYFHDPGVTGTTTMGNTYVNRNYNFVISSNGEFVYHADSELFFEFEGDDDVYLFIDGKLVLDIGGAHSITNVRMEVNDYAEVLGLEEGNTYRFDFFYMERHGFGSNMRIESNIAVTDPGMITEKKAWQNDEQIEYGSIINKDEVVEYGFAIKNNGEENLYNLTFTDGDIGVGLDPINGLKVTGSRVYDAKGGTLNASDLTAIITHKDYDDITVTFADNNALKTFLADLTASGTEKGAGLFVGATVLIRGIGYKLSAEQIEKGVFDNTVLTTSTNRLKTKVLQGQATMRVFVPADPMYYQWAGHKIIISKEKLITNILAAANQADNILNGQVANLKTSNVNKIEFVTSKGNPITYANVSMDGSYNLTVNYPNAGSNVFYVKITYNSSKESVIVPVLINVTSVQDSIYVLDYGLKVNLTENNEAFKNDKVTVPGRDTIYGILAMGSNGAYSPNEITFDSSNAVDGSYGNFVFNDGTIIYTPDAFIEGIDNVQVAVNVYENGTTPSKITGTLDINNEVEMYKNISILPANVVYYEDDFPAITYNMDSDGDKIVNTFEPVKDGNGSSDLSQSNDQNGNYGSDNTYADAVNDEYSGNSLTKITIYDGDMTASFNFKGTGFELIGRTNAKDSATLSVKIYDSNNNVVKNIPVITEFDNGANGGEEEIYQVPVVRVNDMPLDTYKVEIKGIPARDFDNVDANGVPAVIPTVLYIDGLRIYQPMGAINDNYNDNENGATFAEIRDMILSGHIAVSLYDGEIVDSFTGNTSWTENRNGEDHNDITYEGNQVKTVDQYLTMGPNNEAYMNGDLSDSALIFYVENDTTAETHNLQIAVHAVDAAKFYVGGTSGMKAKVRYGVKEGTEIGWKDLVEVTSGTEQYYMIPYTECPYVDGKGYQVAIQVESGMASFTSLKYNGLLINQMIGEASTLYYNNGVLTVKPTGAVADVANYMAFDMIGLQMRSMAVFSAEDTDDIPEVPGGSVDAPEVEEPVEDENGMPNLNEYTNRAEFIKKLIEFLKKFWGR